MKISKRVREEAAVLCALMASSRQPNGRPLSDFNGPCESVGIDCFEDDGPADLARAAYWHVPKWSRVARTVEERHAVIQSITDNAPLHWAEAEAMIRTGWSPDWESTLNNRGRRRKTT